MMISSDATTMEIVINREMLKLMRRTLPGVCIELIPDTSQNANTLKRSHGLVFLYASAGVSLNTGATRATKFGDLRPK